MASSKESLEYVLDLLSGLDDITYRAMMGEYVLYYRGKVFGGIDLYSLMLLNPVTPVLDTFKHGALGAGEFVGWGWLAYSFTFMFVILAIGILIFNKVQRNFMDTV